LTGEKPPSNSFYGLLKSTSETSENSTAGKLKSISGINSVSFKNNIHIDYNKSMKSIDTVVFVLIISAGVLAFVVIYNLTNINISERKRELATIKLLGFFNNELAAYIYRENMILTLLGSIIGIFAGMVMSSIILDTAETNLMMFSKKIGTIYFVCSVLLTILFSVIVNLAMYKRFDNIDMIESLKSPE
jgi:putative ABC transport system permease protein